MQRINGKSTTHGTGRPQAAKTAAQVAEQRLSTQESALLLSAFSVLAVSIISLISL